MAQRRKNASRFGPVNPARDVLPLPPLRAMDRRLCAFESSLVMRSSEGYLVPPFALDSIGRGHIRGVGRSDGKSVSGGSRKGRRGGTARTSPCGIVHVSKTRITAVVSRLPAKPLEVTDSGARLQESSWRCCSRQDSDLCKIQLSDNA
jgi:hypothetical protein